VLSVEYISFEDIKPEGYYISESWGAMGIGEDDTVYVGFTSMRPDEKEDFVLFSYNRHTGEKKLIGTMMEVSAAADNLGEDEVIPKGHTRMIVVDGKVYMGSQGFHDFKWDLEGKEEAERTKRYAALPLESFRGSHLYCYDIEAETFTDISAGLPGGIVTEHEGIVALQYMPSTGCLVGLTHPHSNLVFFDIETNEVTRFATGIPWEIGAVVSRGFAIDDDNQRVYIWRGPENTYWNDGTAYTKKYNATSALPVYCYDFESDTLTRTVFDVSGSIWGNGTVTPDGAKAYITTANGNIVEIDFAAAESNVIGNVCPNEVFKYGNINFLYAVNYSRDGTKIYSIPTYHDGNATGLFEYDIVTGEKSMLEPFPSTVYTGGVVDSEGVQYFTVFGDDDWKGNCRLMILEMG